MFTWDWACKHTVFFYSQGFTGRQAAQEDRQHRKTGSTGRQAAQEDRQHREQAAQEDRQHREQAAQEDRQQAAPEHIAQFVHSGMQRTASGRLVSRRVTRGQIAQSVHSGQGDRAISWP